MNTIFKLTRIFFEGDCQSVFYAAGGKSEGHREILDAIDVFNAWELMDSIHKNKNENNNQ